MSPSLCFLTITLIINVFISLVHPTFGARAPNNADGPMHLELIHRHSIHHFQPKTRLERVTELVRMDSIRIRMISERLQQGHHNLKRRTLENANVTTSCSDGGGGDGSISTTARHSSTPSSSSAVLPISSGAYSGTGQYFVPFRVGTPSKTFLLVADTGSDLTWINCDYKCPRGRKCDHETRSSNKIHKRKRIFHADRSSSFKPIPCSTPMCKSLPFSLVRCPAKTSTCHYDYRYTDGSAALGIFGNETVTVNLMNGRKAKLTQVVIGCSSASLGSSFRGSDGVLGLGYSKYSFAVKAANKFGGGLFSYCLVDHLSPKNVSSFLTFGHRKQGIKYSSKGSIPNAMQYTKLILDVIDGFYPVKVVGLSVGGMMLRIPLNIWDLKGEGGVIIDSGTSLTFLAEPAYGIVMTALKLPLMRFKQVKLEPFEFCFNSLGFNEALVPKLVFHFDDSARFGPPVKSYIIDVSDGVKCIGLMSNSFPAVSIIGNIMQQNYMWEFDLRKKRLGFMPSTCANN